jgi:hypothetical protein
VVSTDKLNGIDTGKTANLSDEGLGHGEGHTFVRNEFFAGFINPPFITWAGYQR